MLGSNIIWRSNCDLIFHFTLKCASKLSTNNNVSSPKKTKLSSVQSVKLAQTPTATGINSQLSCEHYSQIKSSTHMKIWRVLWIYHRDKLREVRVHFKLLLFIVLLKPKDQNVLIKAALFSQISQLKNSNQHFDFKSPHVCLRLYHQNCNHTHTYTHQYLNFLSTPLPPIFDQQK